MKWYQKLALRIAGINVKSWLVGAGQKQTTPTIDWTDVAKRRKHIDLGIDWYDKWDQDTADARRYRTFLMDHCKRMETFNSRLVLAIERLANNKTTRRK